MARAEPPSADEPDTRRIERYEKLRQFVDEDALHDLIARHGAAILDREFPYVIVAARNQLWGGRRRRIREALVSTPPERAEVAGRDPADLVTAKISFEELAGLLSTMSDSDVLLLWRYAEGVPDEEVIEEWKARGLGTGMLTRAALRKRRQRARERLNAMTSAYVSAEQAVGTEPSNRK